ncbi:MAG: hypothetical protein QW035_03705 [Candidatus Anstonellales archaeon]
MQGIIVKEPIKRAPCTTLTEVSEEEVLLAKALAEKAFKEKTNMARDKIIEFLLFLEGKRQISDLKKANTYLALPVFCSLKGIKGKRIVLKKKALWDAIERISLSRI